MHNEMGLQWLIFNDEKNKSVLHDMVEWHLKTD